jgi:hypothetical protein
MAAKKIVVDQEHLENKINVHQLPS